MRMLYVHRFKLYLYAPRFVGWLRLFWADGVIAVSRVDRVRSSALAMIRVRIASDVLCNVALQREEQR